MTQKRKDLKKLYGIFSSVIDEWTEEQVEMEWYYQFQAAELLEED